MTKPMRVCEFVGNMNGGGVETVVMNYYRHIDRSKVQFDFVVTEGSTIVPREEMEGLGGRVFMVPAYTHLLQFQRANYALFRAHPEWLIVHAHMNALNVFPLASAAKAGVPVRIAHSHSASGRGELVRNAIKGFLRTQANRYPTQRFACTEHAGRWLFGDYPFEVVPNPIDFECFRFKSVTRQRVRFEWHLPEGAFAIGHVGRWATPKNQIFLVDVLKACLDAGMNAYLVLVGDGPDRMLIKGRALKLGVQDRMITPGYMDSVDAYSGFDVFTFPSRYEGFGMAVMEAQASGLLCLISDTVPYETDLTGNCTFLPINDARVWARVLGELCPNKLTRHIDFDDMAYSKYNSDKIALWLKQRYIRLYEEARKS